ncbi:hypothetical protein EJ110_NYTH46676 [Nymphaea thermarum]|nr:hypothetical protein EJ110_NYTH46676 [Nymphaea thermarum]
MVVGFPKLDEIIGEVSVQEAEVQAEGPQLGERRSYFLSAFRASCRKVVKRLVEGRAHFGELFAGNYMFMQVTAGAPSMGYCLDKQLMAQQCSQYLPSKGMSRSMPALPSLYPWLHSVDLN